MLTPTGAGTVTVTAANPASGVKGSAVIYITEPPEVIAQGFSVVNTPDFKGYNVGFTLKNITTSDVYCVEVTLWYGAFQLAKCTSYSLMTKYPNATDINVPFDVFGAYDYAADGIWNYNNWKLKTEIPTKAAISVTFRTAYGRFVEITSLTGDPMSLFPST